MNDESIVKIMQALDLDYSKAILSTMHFGQSIETVNKQLAGMKAIAMQSAKDINTAFSSQLGQFAGNKTIVDQYGNSLVTIGDMTESASKKTEKLTKAQREQSQAIQEVIKQYKAGIIDAQKFVDVASEFKVGPDQWRNLPDNLKKDQVNLQNQLIKAENEHRRILSEKSKIIEVTNQQIKASSIESMKAQAASIQQRASAKGLSQEYAKQAGTIREQLSLIQAQYQAEGKLSAEEVKQTQQLKEQLDILNAQTKTAISDKTRENPDWFGEEMQRRVSWFATGGLFYGMTNAAKEATQTIKEVEMGMVEIARVMTDSSFVFDEYRDNLFKLGIDYGQTFTNVQSVALRWAQSGYNVADSLELTKTSLLALNTAELDATQATEAMIGIMAQWQLQAEDMALVMDKINITADRHSVTSQDLVDGLLRSSGAARIMNLSLEETIGLLTVMREASGRTGQEVGNALNSILSYIQRPGSIKTLEELGINMFADSAKTQFRNVLDIFKDIASNWNTLSADIQDGFVKSAADANLFSEELSNALGMQEEWNDLQQRDISQAAAGVYRRNYFIGMIERLANVQGVLNNMMDAEGYSMRENAKTMETLEKKQESLKASMEALAVAAGDAGLGGSFKALASGGTTALNTINKMPKEMKDLVMATTSTFIAVKTLEMGMKTFGIQLPGISQMITSLTTGTWSLTAAFKAGGAGIATFAKANAPLLALSAAVGVIIAVKNAIKKQREEQEKAIEVAKDNIQTYEEQKQGLVELSKEYETLKSKEKNLTATADEKQRLIEIQRELVELYGVSITGIDAEGQAYADSTNAIQDRIKALEELKALEQERLETAVMSRNNQDVENLKKHLAEKEQLETDLLKIQEQINKYTNALVNKEITTSLSGSTKIDGSTEHGAKMIRDYIGNLSREKANLDKSLDDVRNSIADDTKETQQLLKEDAVKIVQQLDKNGVVISDSARAYATELAKALSQVPTDIFSIRTALESEIKKFTSSDFEEWSDKYQKAIANNDTKGIDEASNAINGLVRTFVEGKPHLENFALAMEYAFANSNALKDANKSTIDLKTSLTNMGVAAKKAFDDLKTLNQAINDVKRGQSLSVDTILELIEKYNLSTDAIKQTTKGYTVEVSALENLRDAKIKTATDGIEAEKRQAEAVRDSVLSRLKNYGLEIEQLKNLAAARAALAQSVQEKSHTTTSINAHSLEQYNEQMADVALYEKAVNDLEEINKRADMLTALLNDKSYGVSTSKSKDKKDERQFLESIDAEIRAIKVKNDYLLDGEKSLQEQLKLAKDISGIEGLNHQYRLTGELIEHNKTLLQSFKEEQDLIHARANKLREDNQKYNIDSWFDSNGEATLTYINLYNNATKKQQEELDKVFGTMQKLKKAWMESNEEAKKMENIVKDLGRDLEKHPDKVKGIVKELIEAEKRNAYLKLELDERDARDKLKKLKKELDEFINGKDGKSGKQGEIDKLQGEIEETQESERARQESRERQKRLDEIEKLEKIKRYLENDRLDDITEEQAKLVGLEKERESYLKRQTEIQKLQLKLDKLRNDKNIQQLTKLKDGSFDFTYVADEKEIDEVNKKIVELQEEQSKSIKDIKESNLDSLKKLQEDYDEWEYQNSIQKSIREKQQRIKDYQDEIKDKQDKYAEEERITNEHFTKEKQALDDYYRDIDKITSEKLEELRITFDGKWSEIGSTLQIHFDSIATEYDALVNKLSQPLPTPKMPTMGVGGAVTGIVLGIGGLISNGFKSVFSGKGFNTGGETQKTGLHWLDGEIGEPERVLSVQQTKDFNKLVTYVPDLLDSINTSKNLIPDIRIPDLNKSQSQSTTILNQSNTPPTQVIHNHIDKLVFPNVHDAKEIEDSILGLPRITIQQG